MKKTAVLLFMIFFAPFVSPALAGDAGIVPLPKDMDTLTLENYVEAVKDTAAMGANATLLAPNWREMEPQPSSFDFDKPIGGALYSISEGMSQLYLNLQIINTIKRELPPDLSLSRWDDPKLLERFEALIKALKDQKQLAPLCVSIGNEVDVYFESHPDELEPYLSFLTSARRVIRKYFGNIPVGVTVTFEGTLKDRLQIIQKLAEKSDILYFTYYPVIDFKILDFKDIPKHLEKMKSLAGDKKIVIQEIGFPSGTLIGSGKEKQAEFFKTALPVFLKDGQVDTVFVFALHDFSPGVCNNLLGYYAASGWPQDFQSKFKDFLCTLGLRDSEGIEKPALSEVRKILKQK
ncbi:MAG: glycosyl hydrolase 53 family protein [Alphaproteobacteria bacterium]|nr:glycosyl hydrolase 53 family protein [Alphaproteobacteria bacterium]